MNTVRTTIVFDEALYRQLAVQAAVMGVGLSELINKKLVNRHVGMEGDAKARLLAKHQAVFRALGRKFGKTDWAKLVREERNSGHDR